MKNTTNQINKCRICGSVNQKSGSYPDIHFNNKVFSYYACNYCYSYNVFPSPTSSDLELIYGETDHKYFKNISDKISYPEEYHFANHQGYQIKFLNEIKNQLQNKTLLDFACGSGFYLNHAQKLGAKVVGIEFNKEFVELLIQKTNFEIYTLDEALLKYKDSPFDFIHLGHILEHLTEPQELLNSLKNLAHKTTVFLIDGPLEKNFCLSRWYVDIGSRLKNKKFNTFAPQHLSLTTNKSQQLFFKKAGLEKINYQVVEQFFPLPSGFSKSATKNFNFIIAYISILVSLMIPFSGNIFHYRGKLK